MKTVSSKIGHYFLNLLDKHFPKKYNFTVFSTELTSKVGHSCTKNIKAPLQTTIK